MGDLVAAAPAWSVLPILIIGLAGGVGQGVLNLYASGLDPHDLQVFNEGRRGRR